MLIRVARVSRDFERERDRSLCRGQERISAACSTAVVKSSEYGSRRYSPSPDQGDLIAAKKPAEQQRGRAAPGAKDLA